MVQLLHPGSKYQKLLIKSVPHCQTPCSYQPVTAHENILASIAEDADIILCFDKKDAFAATVTAEIKKHLAESVVIGLLFLSAPDDDQALSCDALLQYLPTPPKSWQVVQAIDHLSHMIALQRKIRAMQQELVLRKQELAELNRIGIALSSERELDTLLELILQKAREITSADAGSLYLIEKNPLVPWDENNFWRDKQLRFKLAHNDSISASYQEFVMPVERKSMAGYTVLSGRPLNIADAYNLPPDSAFQHNRSFDERMGYHTKSVLCIPLHTHQGEMIGVLQLINRKKDIKIHLTDIKHVVSNVIPFDNRCEDLALSLASQAAVSIENMRLYDEIKRLFEGFIVASVHAIEQRDPTTYGHSERVATLTLGMAEQVSRQDYGPFKSISFSREDLQQIRYAALLHDFGKIGVREKILVKANKLYPEQLAAILLRGQYIKKALEFKVIEIKMQNKSAASHLEATLKKQIDQIDRLLEFIIKTNEPVGLTEKEHRQLQQIGRISFAVDDKIQPLLHEEEMAMLCIHRGSLSDQERREIESHVIHTYNFLVKIPWATHLKEVPDIAYSHHEKLDGSGYPRGLAASQIPIHARMIAIADIFDALTAWDRPYKKAVSIDRALEILEAEAKEGKLDADLLHLFIGTEIFRLVSRSNAAD